MKSLLVSALAVGVAVGIDSAYYIGNYSAGGTINAVPYPLGICVPTGALSGFTYSIFTCADNNQVEQKKYASTDTTCAKDYTTVLLPRLDTPGLPGYTHCDGPTSYMVIYQYLNSCNNWKTAKSTSAVTVVAVDACSRSSVSGGVSTYSRSTCNGEEQIISTYEGDNTCTASDPNVTTTTRECHFFGIQQNIFKIYSATVHCVIDGEPQRCESPLVSYKAAVTVRNITNNPDYETVYSNIFQYATVGVEGGDVDVNNSAHLNLSLGFCTQFEDAKYATLVEDLGDTTLSSSLVDAKSVCWNCTQFVCANMSRCGTDTYCNPAQQCALTATTTTAVATTTSTTSTTSTLIEVSTEDASPANIIYVSFTLIMGLFLSWTLF